MVSGSRKISLLGAVLCPSFKRGIDQPRADTAFVAGVLIMTPTILVRVVSTTPIRIVGVVIMTPATLPHDKLGSHVQLLTTPRNPTEPNRNP